MSRRLFLRVAPGVLAVTAALVLTHFDGGSEPRDSPLSFTLGESSTAVPFEPVVLRRRTITPEFDPPLDVSAVGRLVHARGFLACDPGEIFRVEVTVEQGDTEGHGRTVGRCTGEEQLWEAVVVAREGGSFVSGPSSACAVATTRRVGITDTFEWCGTPVLAAD